MQLPKDIPIAAFRPLRVLKQGADCRVDLVQHVESGAQYVLKSFDRQKVMQNGSRIDSVMNESNVLKLIAGITQGGPFAQPQAPPSLNFPSSLNRLVTTTKDENTLCLVLQRARHIDLVTFMKLLDPKLKYDGSSHVFRHCNDLMSFIRHLTIQLVIAFDALHQNSVLYKDLKATHVFLDEQLRVTLIDFGLSEQVTDGATSVPGGTMHAMSPEMLMLYTKKATGQQDRIDYTRECVGFAHDFYSLGVLILELIDPELIKYFRNEPGSQQSQMQRLNEYFQTRMNDIYSVEQFDHNADIAEDFLAFLQGLLVPDAAQRLATKEAIFSHPFIQREDNTVAVWEAVGRGEQPPAESILSSLGLSQNVYLKELLNLIDLSSDEQIDVEEDDDEELTPEQQELFDDF